MTPRTLLPLLLVLASAAPAAELPGITVHVLDLAGVPDAVLDPALHVATVLCARSGVSLRWVRQPEVVVRLANGKPFRHERTAAEFSLWFLPRHLSREFAGQADLSAGMADTGSDIAVRTQATILYDRIQGASGSHPEVKLSALLGLMIAHELGHLFLGPGAHQRNTIMTPRWEAADFRTFLRGQLSFTPEQAAAIRANAAARLQKAKPAQVSRGGSAIPTEKEALTSSSNYSRKQ